LGDSAQHLPDQHGSRRLFQKEVWRRRRYQRHAEVLEEVVSGELNREIAGKAIGAFHNDGAKAVAGDAVEHVLEAFPRSASCLP
jgi:hypothetical protein